jgi:hypothetical protein
VNDKTMKGLGGFLSRFGPYLALVAAIVAVIGFLPGDDETGELATASGQFGEFDSGDGDGETDFPTGSEGGGDFTGGDFTGGGGGGDFGSDGSTTGSGASSVSTGGASSSGGGGTTAGTVAGGGGDAAGAQPQPTAKPQSPQPVSGPVANCDQNTGRIAVPSHYSPVCVKAFAGDNGGSTYRGVSKDKIKVAVYMMQDDPTSQAILAAAGADDSDEEKRQQHAEFVEFYGTHYETYGRQVEIVFIPGSSKATDDAAGRADAQRVIDSGAFASINAPNDVYVDELVANGVMCFCTTSKPIDYYHSRAPFVWSGDLMSSTQGYVHRAEFIGKRLEGKAVHAGDPVLQAKERVFGLAYYEDDQQSYRPGIDFFINELKQKYGITLAAQVAYKGYPDTAASQEAARPLIQKMVASGVTSMVCACDPFAPIFFTQEATRQRYFPEWVVTGSALTDTSFFARTYDQTQWANAFGVSFLPARVPEEKDDLYSKLFWHFGREPTAEGTYGVLGAPWAIFWEGVHLAGPKLDPGTFRDGLFRAPPAAQGKIAFPTSSFGQGTWPFDDYLAWDDITLIWWDPQAKGEDEIGNNGVGLYRYVDMGKRYLPGQQPNAPTKAFQPENTITIYTDYPPGDAPPQYPRPQG